MAKGKVKTEFEIISEKLDKVISLLEHSIAINLYVNGATQDDLTKNLHIGKQTANEFVHGLAKKEKAK